MKKCALNMKKFAWDDDSWLLGDDDSWYVFQVYVGLR